MIASCSRNAEIESEEFAVQNFNFDYEARILRFLKIQIVWIEQAKEKL